MLIVLLFFLILDYSSWGRRVLGGICGANCKVGRRMVDKDARWYEVWWLRFWQTGFNFDLRLLRYLHEVRTMNAYSRIIRKA